MKKKGFTLLELIIVMAILGILFVLLLRTYNWVATMVFRVQQEKEVTQEILQISQIIQNFSDRNTIDYSKYGSGDLVKTQGIAAVLYLSGQDGQISFYASGICVEPANEYVLTGAGSGCSLYMQSGDKQIELINTNKIAISKVIFKIIPFASEQEYIDSTGLCAEGNYLHCLNSPGFRMIFKAYSINYGTQWATHVTVPFQQFF
ncbi:MAG: type II secretion system protein [Candidatus Absconditabacterales bacterium]